MSYMYLKWFQNMLLNMKVKSSLLFFTSFRPAQLILPVLAFKSLLLGQQQEFSQVLSSRIKIIQTLRSGLGFSLLISLLNLHLPQLEGLSLYMALFTFTFVSFKHYGFWTTCSGLGPLTQAPNKICTKINDFKEFYYFITVMLIQLR